MVRETRASLELIEADDHPNNPEADPHGLPQPPQWLRWLASADPRFTDAAGNPVVSRIAAAGGMRKQTLHPIATRTRTPTLDTVGEIVALGARLHGVPDDVALKHIVRIVRRPVGTRTAAR